MERILAVLRRTRRVRRQGKRREKDSWIQEAERKLGRRFRNRALLRAALTHPSAGGEGRTFERLEFLGDAILSHLVGLHLYKSCPDLSPGGLTRLRANMVNRAMLARAAKHLGLPTMLRLGKSEEPGGRQRPTLLAAAFEAVVAALFLDRGLGSVTKFLEQHLLPWSSPDPSLDPKSELQAIVQAALKIPPRYRLLQHWGPPHARRFEVEVEVRGQRLARGKGGSRREAERVAARRTLASLRINHNILGSSSG
ncbi:MAG: ribonuclease III [candidate division NC10 bacterium]